MLFLWYWGVSLGVEGEVMCRAVGFILRWEGCGCGWMDGWFGGKKGGTRGVWEMRGMWVDVGVEMGREDGFRGDIVGGLTRGWRFDRRW